MKTKFYLLNLTLSFLSCCFISENALALLDIARFNITNASHNTTLDKQEMILKSSTPPSDPSLGGGYIKNKAALEKTTQSGIVLTQKNLDSLKENFCGTPMEVDLLSYDNLRVILLNVLNMALSKDAGPEFPSELRATGTKIHNSLYALRENLLNHWTKEISTEDMTDTEIEQERLLKSYEALKAIHQIILAETVIANALFTKFIYGIMLAYKVVILQHATALLIAQNRAEVEEATQTNTKSVGGSIGAKSIGGVIQSGVTLSIQHDEGMDDTSFYKTKSKGGIHLSAEGGFGKLLAKFGVGVEVAHEVTFWSLEQLMDSGKFKGGHLKVSVLKDMLKSRKKMQEKEKKFLAIFRGDVEAFLKIIRVIPSSVEMVFPHITRVSELETAKSVKLDVGVEATAASVGFKLKIESSTKIHTQNYKYLSFLEDDCSAADGLRASDVEKILDPKGSRYNFSSRYIKQIEEYTSDAQENAENIYQQARILVLSNILDDIKRYNNALSMLANPSSSRKQKKDQEKAKHAVEARWLSPTKKLTSEGRDGVLRSFVVTCAYLRELCASLREIGILKSIYNEICKLSALCEFSKDKSKRNAEVGLKAKGSDISWGGQLSIPGGINAALHRIHSSGHPFMEDNGDFIDVVIDLPMSILGLFGIRAIQSKMTSAFGSLKMQKGEASEGLGNASDVFRDAMLLLASNSSIPFISNVTSMIPIGSSQILIRLRRIDTSYLCTRPLPGIPVIVDRNRNRWEIMYVQAMSFSNLGLSLDTASISSTIGSLAGLAAQAGGLGGKLTELGGKAAKIGGSITNLAGKVGNAASNIAAAAESALSVVPVSFSASINRSLGKRERIIGSDSIFYPTSRFNVAALGAKYSNSDMSTLTAPTTANENGKAPNTLWLGFLNKQSHQLMKLFANISDLSSNAFYELQVLFNKTLDNCPADKVSEYTEAFRKFITACNKFAYLPLLRKAFIDFLRLEFYFIRYLRRCRKIVANLESLAANMSEDLSLFFEELRECRNSASFLRIYSSYYKVLGKCCRNTKDKETRKLLKKLSSYISKCLKWAKKLSPKSRRKKTQKEYFANLEKFTEKTRGCTSLEEYKVILRAVIDNWKAIQEPYLSFVDGTSQEEMEELEEADKEESEEKELEEDESSDIDSEKSESKNKLKHGTKDTHTLHKGTTEQTLPSNYERIISDPESMKVIDKFLTVAAQLKKNSKREMEGITSKELTPELLNVISVLDVPIQDLVTEIAKFNIGILKLFLLAMLKITEEYTKVLTCFNEIMRINHQVNFLRERKEKFGVVQTNENQ